MTFLATLGLIAGVWLIAMATTSLAVTSAWLVARRLLARLHPEVRVRVAGGLAVAPLAVSTLSVAICLAPGLATLTGLTTDHCLTHAAHPHLCLVHATAELTATLAALFALGAGVTAILLLRGLVLAARGRKLLAHFGGLRPLPLAPGVARVQSERPFSFTIGWARPVARISSALCDALSPPQLAAVVAHEQAHVARRDPLRRLTAAVLSLVLPPAVRRGLLTELELACEQACDLAAARAVGDPLLVAEALLAAERRMAGEPAFASGNVTGVAESAIPIRVRSLLDADRGRGGQPERARSGRCHGSTRRTVLLGLAFAAVALWAAIPIHHAAEHLIELFQIGI